MHYNTIRVLGWRPLVEGGEDPVLAHDGLVEDDLGAQVKLSPQADLQHGGVVDHGGVAVVLEHLGAGLGGEHVDGPASQAVGGVVDVELEASADVGRSSPSAWSRRS